MIGGVKRHGRDESRVRVWRFRERKKRVLQRNDDVCVERLGFGRKNVCMAALMNRVSY